MDLLLKWTIGSVVFAGAVYLLSSLVQLAARDGDGKRQPRRALTWAFCLAFYPLFFLSVEFSGALVVAYRGERELRLTEAVLNAAGATVTVLAPPAIVAVVVGLIAYGTYRVVRYVDREDARLAQERRAGRGRGGNHTAPPPVGRGA